MSGYAAQDARDFFLYLAAKDRRLADQVRPLLDAWIQDTDRSSIEALGEAAELDAIRKRFRHFFDGLDRRSQREARKRVEAMFGEMVRVEFDKVRPRINANAMAAAIDKYLASRAQDGGSG